MKRLARDFTGQQWAILGACFVLMGLFSSIQFFFGIFLDPLVGEFGWSRSAASAPYSLNYFIMGAGAMAAGYLADRYGTRPIILVGSLCMGGSLIFSYGIHSLWHYYLLAGILAGLGRSAFLTPVQAFIQRSFSRSRGLATGLAGSGTGMGIFLLTPLAGYLVQSSGWRSAYLILGVIFLVVALPAAMFLRIPEQPAETGSPERPGQRHKQFAPLPESNQAVAKIVRRKPFWAILGSHTCDCVCHSVLIVHLVPIAIEAGLHRVEAAGLVGAMGIGALTGRILVGALADRIGAKRALFTTLLFQTLPTPLLLMPGSIALFYPIAFSVGIGLGGHGTMYPVVTRDFYGPKRVGLLYGAFSTGASAGMATGGFMGGLLYDLSGNYHLSILFSFTMGILSLAAVLLYPRLRLQEETPETAPEPAAQPAG